jgi:hypothetical protein
LIRGRIEQRGDLRFGQLLSSHHSCLPGIPVTGRPADPGEEVDQGGVLEAEGAGRQPPCWRRCIGSAERPAKENRDGFPQGRARCHSQGRLSSWFVRLCVKSGRFVTSGRYVSVPSNTPITLPPPGLPFSLVFRAEPGKEDVLLEIASAYEGASKRRIPPPAFGPLQTG